MKITSDFTSALVQKIHSEKHLLPKFTIAATGGGLVLQSIFALVPGISSSLLEMIYPYAKEKTEQYLGLTPAKFASEECALELAMKAYQDSVQYGEKALGIGVSCALATERKLQGGERAFVALFGEDSFGKTCAYSLNFDFQSEEVEDYFLRREKQEKHLASITIWFLFQALKDQNFDWKKFNLTSLLTRTSLQVKKFSSQELYNQILKRKYFSACGERKEQLENDPKKVWFLFPCTANPPHEGHFGMAETAQKTSKDGKTIFNLTIDPPHKPLVEPHEILLRTKLINQKGYDCYVYQGDGLYIEKLRRHKMRLVMGYDAFEAFLNGKYYQSEEELQKVIREVIEHDLLLYVFSRQINGETKSPLRLAEERFPELLSLILEREGTWNVSSSQIRAQLEEQKNAI